MARSVRETEAKKSRQRHIQKKLLILTAAQQLLQRCDRHAPVNGTGIHTLDGKNHEVGPGSAMLTRRGSTHSIRQTGEEDLFLLINYRKQE